MPQAGLSSDIIAVFDQLQTGILVLSDDLRIVYLNPSLRTLLQASAVQYVNTPIQDYLSVADVEALLVTPDTAGQTCRAATWQTSQGKMLRLKFKNSAIVVQGQSLILSAIEPFSEDMALNQAHRDFVSTISHEFRTPLTSIKGFADTLLNYGSQLEPEQQRRFIRIMKDQADRLIRLVEALLEVSKNGDGRLEMTLRPVPLKKLAERITQSVAIKSVVPHPFVLDIADNFPPVWADADRLEQVLTNLVDNAVKYSGADRTVTVRASEFTREDAEWVKIDVADEGPGIAPEHLDKLFTQFYRIEGPLTQKVEGTGLGLYITKSLTVAMGGEISVESTLGKGTVFSVKFPVATLERQAAYHRRRYAEEAPAGFDEKTSGEERYHV